MDQGDTLLDSESDDALNVEIGADRSFFFSKLVGLVRFKAVPGKAILFCIDRDSSKAKLSCGSEDPDGDFAPVNDHELIVIGFCRGGGG